MLIRKQSIASKSTLTNSLTRYLQRKNLNWRR